MSPILFLIMFNDLLEELSRKGYKVFVYADDLAIIEQKKFKLKDAINIV